MQRLSGQDLSGEESEGGLPCSVIHHTLQRQEIQQESLLAKALSEKHCDSTP